MAKKEDPPKPGAPAWTSTFGDLMNLLLCFFVLLFSMSTMDAQKFEEVAASFSSAFGIFSGGELAFGEGALIGDGVSQLQELSSFITSMGASDNGNTTDKNNKTTEGESGEDSSGADGEQDAQEKAQQEQLEASEKLAEQIEAALDRAQLDAQVDTQFTSQYVQLTIQGSILFNSGSVDIKEEAYPVIDKVGAILESYAGGTIEIEGHTDNVPMSSSRGKYANNDELSDGRALSIFNYLVSNTTLDPANIKHSGRGEYDPIADNSTAEGRARNRRVEIRIYNPLSPMY